jgi:hypothetical protein
MKVLVLCNRWKNLKMQFTLNYKLQIAANVGEMKELTMDLYPTHFLGMRKPPVLLARISSAVLRIIS